MLAVALVTFVVALGVDLVVSELRRYHYQAASSPTTEAQVRGALARIYELEEEEDFGWERFPDPPDDWDDDWEWDDWREPIVRHDPLDQYCECSRCLADSWDEGEAARLVLPEGVTFRGEHPTRVLGLARLLGMTQLGQDDPYESFLSLQPIRKGNTPVRRPCNHHHGDRDRR